MIEIYAVNIEKSINNFTLDKELKLLDYYGEGKHRDYHFKDDLHRSVLGEMMVRTLLCNKSNLKNSQLSFYKNKFGKPYIRGNNNLFFNVSHSKSWVCVAISDKEIGIDIEEIKKKNITLSRTFFNPSEIEYIDGIDNIDTNKTRRFFEVWTMKESLIKAVGKGLSLPLTSFELKQDTENPFLWFTYYMNVKYCFRVFSFQKNYMVSVSTSENLQYDDIKIISCSELFMGFHIYT